MESKKKLWCAVLAALLVCTGMVAVFSVTRPATAGDIGGPIEDFSLVNAAVNDVMWAPDGSWGLAVGVNNSMGAVWVLQDPVEDTLWNFPTATTAPDTAWYALDWSDALGGFYIVGHNATVTNVYTYDPVGGFQEFSTAGGPNAVLRGIAMDPGGASFMVVGTDGGSGAAYYWNGVWSSNLEGDFDPAEHILYDVAFWDGSFIMVGQNTTTSRGITFSVSKLDLDGGDVTTVALGFETDVETSMFNSVAWVPGKSYGVVVGNRSTVYKVGSDGNSTGRILPRFMTTENYTLNSVRFDWEYTDFAEAVVVGANESGNPVAMRLIDDAYSMRLTHVTGSPMNAGPTALCGAFKTYSSPRYAVVLGTLSGFRLNNVEASHDITVYTIYPHIDEMDLYTDYDEPGEVSVMNDKVDVDSGVLTLRLQCRHDMGWLQSNVNRVEVYMWWDNGLTGADSRDYGSARGAEAANNNHTMFNFTLSSGNFEIVNPGLNEISLVSGAEMRIDDNNYTLLFNFTLGKQVWASTALPAATAGPKSNGDQMNVTDGLATPFTWDIHARIVGTVGGEESRYDEFGVYIYKEFSAAGLPGMYTGSGPPSSTIGLSTTGNPYANFSANYNYSFGVYAVDHLWNPDLSEAILINDGAGSGDQLKVRGGDIANYENFTDIGYPGGVIRLLGNGSSINWVLPNLQHNWTRTNTARDGVANTNIAFQCDVGSHEEDVFSGRLVYIIEHQQP